MQFEKLGGIGEGAAEKKVASGGGDIYGLDQFLQEAKSSKRKRAE